MINLTLKQFILYAFPWCLIDTIAVLLICTNSFASLIILIICYYYGLRLYQLDVYVIRYLKRKRFNIINQQFIKLLAEYADVINEVYQFNKFSSKLCSFFYCFVLQLKYFWFTWFVLKLVGFCIHFTFYSVVMCAP